MKKRPPNGWKKRSTILVSITIASLSKWTRRLWKITKPNKTEVVVVSLMKKSKSMAKKPPSVAITAIDNNPQGGLCRSIPEDFIVREKIFSGNRKGLPKDFKEFGM